ncbi:MAG TPA: hypothetical protein VNI20_08135, partial [Fimbriimonadaceae bacterium]|nr:hypothetical protein [Fimbriimonadaceae bacterium]
MRALLNKWMDKLAEHLPGATKWLWLVGAVGLLYMAIVFLGDRLLPLLGSTESYPRLEIIYKGSLAGTIQANDQQYLVLLVALTLLGVGYWVATVKKWKSKHWLSLGSWAALIALITTVLYSLRVFDLNQMLDDVLFGTGPTTVIGQILDNFRQFFGYFWDWIPLVGTTLFAVILEGHRRRINSEEGDSSFSIGGGWKPVWAWLLGYLVAAFVHSFPPLTVMSIFDVNGMVSQGWAKEPIRWLDASLIWFAGMAVYAWKSGANLSWDDRAVRVRFAKNGLGLVTIPWRRVLRVFDVTVRGRTESVRIESGILPLFRFRFSLHRRRDGERVLTSVLEQAHERGISVTSTGVRRGTVAAGWSFLLL